MTIAFYTLGCKVNQVDSSLLRRQMATAGYQPVELDAGADVIVLNSCAVTAESERKTRQALRRFRKLHPDSVLVLTGCSVQICPNPGDVYVDADLILGHSNALNLPEAIEAFLRSGIRQIIVSQHQRDESFVASNALSADLPALTNRIRANVKIEDGCDCSCAYCVIPQARGPVRSKPLSALQREYAALDQAGFAEIVLVGINLSAYGSDLGHSLFDAILLAEEFPSIKRLRLGSLEPDRLPLALLEQLAKVGKLCPHFHLSLQSGSDRTLQAMRRPYTTADYARTAAHLRHLFPELSITTDIMVGFPGESDADFQESLAFAHQIGFSNMHVFPFSSRPGTAAASLPQQLTRAEKISRSQQMISAARDMRRQFLSSQVGKTVSVLPEEPHPLGGMRGYSANYTQLRIIDATAALRGAIAQSRIIGVEEDGCGCFGVLVL